MINELTEFEQKTIKINSLNYAYLHYENPDKPKVVLLHGWLDNAASFAKLLPFLQNHYELYCFELSGHGASEHISADGHYHLIDWVYDFQCFVNQLSLNNFELIGHSLGGIVATTYAAINGDKVNNLVLLECIGAFVQPPEKMVDNIQQSFETRALISPTQANKKLRPMPLLAGLIDARAKAGAFSHQIAEILIERNIQRKEDGFVFNSDPRLKTISPIRLCEAQAVEILKRVNNKTYIILGDTGYPEIAQSAKTRAQYLSNLERIDTISGGHHFHLENAEETANCILQFLSH